MFARNLSLSVLSKVATTLISVAFLAAAARLFSKEEIAVLALGAIATTLMDLSKGFGLGMVLLKRLPKLDAGGADGASLVLTFLAYSLLIPLGLAGLASLAAAPISSSFFGTPAYAPHLRLSLALGVFQAIINSNILVLQARRQFGWLAVESVLSGLLLRLLPCLAAVLAGLDFLAFLQVSCALGIVACLASFPPLVPCLRVKGKRVLRHGEFWTESRYFYFTRLMRYSTTQMDQVLVAALFSPATLAVYYMVRRLYATAVVMIDSLVDALVPDVSHQAGTDGKAARGRLRAWLRLALLLGAVGGAFLSANGQTVLRIAFGPSYAGDNMLVCLFAVSGVTYFVYCLAQVDLVLFHDPRRLLTLSAVTAGTSLACSLLLAPLAGVRGLPLSMSISYLAGLEVARRSGALSWQPRRLAGSVGLIGITAAVAALASAALGPWLRLFAVNALVALAALALIHRERASFTASLGRLSP